MVQRLHDGLPGEAFDENYLNDTHALMCMHLLVKNQIGTGSILGMRDKYGTIGLYPRFAQPCQGGEMRRYTQTSQGEELHGDKCTRPESGKPSDLHAPYPEGIPVLIGVRKWHPSNGYDGKQRPTFDRALNLIYSKTSPWRCGFGSVKDLRFTLDEKGDRIGVIFTNTKVDPTALVNSIQMVGTVWSWISGAPKMFDILKELGATEGEQLLIRQLAGCNSQVRYSFSPPTSRHYDSTALDIVSYLDGDPDPTVSKGTLFDGYDYNRVRVMQLFNPRSRDIPFFNLKKEMEERGFQTSNISTAEHYKTMLDTIRDAYAVEKARRVLLQLETEQGKAA